MESVEFDYSLKNIPVPDKLTYTKLLFFQWEKWVRRARWRVLEFLGKLGTREKPTFGFKTRNSPPSHPQLDPFEHAVYNMFREIKHKPTKDSFQN